MQIWLATQSAKVNAHGGSANLFGDRDYEEIVPPEKSWIGLASSKHREDEMKVILKSALCGLTALASLAIGQGSALAADAIPFRITLNTGPNHVRNIALQDFVAKLKERTKGKLDVQVFPSSQLVKGPDVPVALAQGAVEMGVPIILYISRVVPNAGIGDLPMFFGRSADDVHKVFDGPVGAALNEEIEKKLRVRVLGKNLDLGHGTLFTAKQPLNGLADIKGLKMRVPGSPASKARYSEAGATAISISFADLPIALAQGAVDGLMTTHETVRSAKLWESGVKYALDTQGTFFQYVPMVGEPTWKKLGPELQKVLTDTWAETVGGARALAAKRQTEARAEGAKNGITPVQATDKELAEFRDKLMAKQDDIIKAARIDPDFAAKVAEALK